MTSIPFVIETIYSSHFRCNCLRNKKFFLNFFFFSFWKSTLNFEHFPKKEQTHSWFISEIKNAQKRCLNKCLKKSCLRGHFENRHGELEEPLLESWRRHVYHIYGCLWKQLRRKKSLLLIWKVLKLFVNPLRKVPLHRRTQPLTVIDHCESNCVGQNLCYWYAKS